MNTGYTVLGTPRSRGLRVLWMLEELEVPYSCIPALPHDDQIKKVNPSGKVPALLVGDEVIVDSVAIMTFLADRHGALTFTPGSLERARQDSFTQAIVDELEGALWMAARHSFILPENLRVPEIKESLRWEFERSHVRLSDRIVGPFVMGERLTIPDILLAHCAGWADFAQFEVTDPRMTEHAEMMRSRPSFARAMAAGQSAAGS